MDEQPIKKLIDDALQDHNLNSGLNDAKIIEAWKKVVPEEIDQQIDKLFVRKGTLYVDVASSALRQDLYYRKTYICNRINQFLKENLLNEIVLK